MRRPLAIALVLISGIIILMITVLLTLQAQDTLETSNAPTLRPVPAVAGVETPHQTNVPTISPPIYALPTDEALSQITPISTPVPTHETIPFDIVAYNLFYDDFTNLKSGWPVLSADQLGNIYGYSAEGYMFDTSLANQILYTINTHTNFIPIHIAVELRSVQGSGRFGIMFNIQGDIENEEDLAYYAVTIATDGAVELLQYTSIDGGLRTVATGTRLDNINHSMLLSLEHRSDALVVRVDGRELLQAPPIVMRNGRIGLLVHSSGSLRVHFDNLIVSSTPNEVSSICESPRRLFLARDSAAWLTGPDVALMQARLTRLGFNPGLIDGIFGFQTNEAVIAFQSVNNLDPDGIVGPYTWCSLLSSDALRVDGSSERSYVQTNYRTVRLLPGVDLPSPLLMSVRDPERRWRIALALPGKREVRYIDTEGDAFHPAWHPRTKQLAFTSLRTDDEQGSVWVLDTSSGHISRASPPGLNAQFPAWSPDGNSLLYTVVQPGVGIDNARGFRYNLTTREHTQLSNEYSGWSDWSHANKIVFVRWTGQSLDLFVSSYDGSNARNLTTTGDADEDIPAWSLDGNFIAFVRHPRSHNHERQIYVMRADGSDMRQLTRLPGPNSNPVWLDANTLAFAHQPQEDIWQLYVTDLVGNAQQLTANDDRVWFLNRFDAE